MNKNIITLIVALLICVGASAQKSPEYIKVDARDNAKSQNWRTYTAKTVDKLPKFKITKEPKQSIYGGWMVNQTKATGFFRTELVDNRWWIIDPEGYPFIHKGVAVFQMGGSDRQKRVMKEKFGTPAAWAKSQTDMLRSYGFNGLGAWSEVTTVRELEKPMAYTVIVNPMGEYRGAHKAKFGGEYKQAGWQGYRFDLAMVFDPEFDAFVDKAIKPIAKYKDDKFLLGYFTDNEIAWVNDALDRHIKYLAKDEAGYIAAKKWLDERKGKDATLEDITPEDRLAFSGFYFETYLAKVAAAVRKYDPNHLYLGCRFNQNKEELVNSEIFRVAGKYMDIVSINHYRLWEPNQQSMANWEQWAGKPFLITEWYTKGEDSGLPNNTGAGWNVKTQAERGYFYQNFAIELLKSKGCVGWHWFTYQDNDPQNLRTDPSNRDSNKGVVNWEYQPYLPLLENMKAFNSNVYQLINYFKN